MQINWKTLTAGLVAVGLSTGMALAQAPTTSPVTPRAPATAPPPVASVPAPGPVGKARGSLKTATTPEGIQCSAEADAQQLKGAPRRKFRRTCIARIKRAGGAATAKKI